MTSIEKLETAIETLNENVTQARIELARHNEILTATVNTTQEIVEMVRNSQQHINELRTRQATAEIKIEAHDRIQVEDKKWYRSFALKVVGFLVFAAAGIQFGPDAVELFKAADSSSLVSITSP